jgi:hypothetical protein
VRDLHEAGVDGDFDDFTGQPPGYEVTMGGETDTAVDADPTGDRRWQRLIHRCRLGYVDDLEVVIGGPPAGTVRRGGRSPRDW